MGMPSRSSAERYELLHRQSDIASDAAKQDRRHIATAVRGHSRRPSVRVAELLVRTALADFLKSESCEYRDDFSRLEDGNRRHPLSGYYDDLSANELARNHGRSFVKDHGDDFLEVFIEFLKRLALTVRTRETGNVSDIESGIRAMLNNGCESLHRSSPVFCCVNPLYCGSASLNSSAPVGYPL